MIGSAVTTVPLSIALSAGGLAVVNPCGFPLLPAFLSFYLGADERTLPRAPTRVLQGLLAGALVTLGFVGFFTAIGLPISYGVGSIASAIPWLGFVTGAVLALAGAAVVAGVQLSPPLHLRIRPRRERGLAAMVLFGVAYGAASLGCTLPIFLALVGASLGAAKLTVFLAYGAGMGVVLMALAVTVALAREGTARALQPLQRHVRWLAGLLLAASGGYLLYYWGRVQFGDSATLADDPIVGLVTRYSAQLQTFATHHGTPLLSVAGAVVAAAAVMSLRRKPHLSQRRGVAKR
jgi:cytochrome c biogenesis protein CcdA